VEVTWDLARGIRLVGHPRPVRLFALSAIGRDRPGIVAAISGVLAEQAVNIEDSQMTILRGHFTMTLIVAVPDAVDPEPLERGLGAVAAELELEALSLRAVGELDPDTPEPSHIATVYGADHPGIVHAVTTVLAEREVDIVDLNTRLVSEAGGESLYALMMELVLPAGAAADELAAALAEVARREAVELSLRELEQDVL
jgi:glycine cleavage system transcriptional repressor